MQKKNENFQQNMKIFKESNFKYLGREGTLILMSGVQNKSPFPFFKNLNLQGKKGTLILMSAKEIFHPFFPL